jgi:GT2 family glycosyltransferase
MTLEKTNSSLYKYYINSIRKHGKANLNCMILQKILWNTTGEYGNTEMFYRSPAAECHTDKYKKILTAEAGTRITFDTYFNMFSFNKWHKYTITDGIKATVTLRGKGKVSLIGIIVKQFEKAAHSIKILESSEYDSKEFVGLELKADIEKFKNVSYCYLQIDTELLTEIAEAAYESNDDINILPIKIACCICTFHREDYVKRNVECMSKALLAKDGVLSDSLEIFIIDNGQTLKKEEPPFKDNKKIHIIYNPNYGGSAGFTRGMIEAAIYRKNEGFTHVLLMDDDILIYPEVLVRTKIFLQLLRKEYHDNILGGAMLLEDNKNIQAESCGYYDVMTGTNRENPMDGISLLPLENIINNEEAEDANFSGWWYSCIPASLIYDGNLPLPLFIHRDDQDFGVRSRKKILKMNGICIWHPSPAAKHSDNIHYYDMRNMLIAIMDLCPDKLTSRYLKKYLTAECIKKILGYRYLGAEMSLEGCRTFLKGPEYFDSINPEQLHKELMERCRANTIQIHDIDADKITEIKERQQIYLSMLTKIIRYLRPDNRTCYAHADCTYPSYLGYKRVILLNKDMKSGIRLERSLKATVRTIRMLISTCIMADKSLDTAINMWTKKIPDMKTLKFWEDYLGLNDIK